MSTVGGARWDRGHRDRDRWEREHERDHERLNTRVDKVMEGLEVRVRKLERSVWTLSAVLATTTIVAIINLVRAAAGVTQ